MSRRSERDSAAREPYLNPGAMPVDPSEEKARRQLARDAVRGEVSGLDNQGVYDEPDILPGRPGEVIEQDWSCSACGYNLRGLPVGHRCPECAHIELYRPPPEGAKSYRLRFELASARVSEATGWFVAAGAVLLGGLFAVFGALIESTSNVMAVGTLIVMVVFGPVVEEVMKIAAATLMVEIRPWLFRRVEQIQLATVGSAAVFAVVENILYLTLYVPNPSGTLIIWRWSVCVVLHVGCTAVATRGLIEVWQRAVDERRPPRMADGYRMLVLAIVIHGLYNGSVIGYELLCRQFGW